ncbi:hypothetical protein D3C76_1005090 [compost metagenome]
MTVGQAQRGTDAVSGLLKTLQFGVAFHRNAEGLQAFDQQPFVFVLREDFEEGVGCQALADAVQRQAGHGLAFYPEIGGRDPMTFVHDGVGQAQLAIQFQRARLHRQCPRGRPRCRRLVDDPYADPQFAQP